LSTICETASMRYSSRVVVFATRTGKCSLRVTAAAGGLEAVELNPTSPSLFPCDDHHPLVSEALRQLQAYFAGERSAFDIPLAPEGTEFQRTVWKALLEIPYGETCSYSDLARSIGNPAAVRAVGAANGRNPIGIIVPCHRVIGSSGKLVGYGGGLPMKRMLLDLEAENAERFRKAATR
jgi:methylated-DNA-[protein]-cysteine S-methyltransferase